MKYLLAAIGCALCITVALFIRLMSAADLPANYPYVPAAYDVTNENLLLFPPGEGGEVGVRLPKALGGYVVSPDGTAIYSTPGGTHNLADLINVMPGLFRIELSSMRNRAVPGSGDFSFFSSMAISAGQQQAVVAGKYRDSGTVVCGVFTIDLLKGKVRQILRADDCEAALAWTDISVSPDLKYAVAIHGRSLELIDLAAARIKTLGDRFMKAAWSPDGKWIAAAKDSFLQARIVLLDSRTFVPSKTLDSSMVLRMLWSPDSRFLLARRSVAGCGPDAFTYETFDVETGKGSLVQSSNCKVWNANDVGWVARSLAANR